jgi:excisionase family DNA binding protein
VGELKIILDELRVLREKVDRIAANTDAATEVILTRDEAAKQLKVSVRQLQRLVRAGRIMAHPSGIARAELERYAKTPQTKLTAAQTAMRRSSVKEEAADLREMLKLRRKRR